MIIIPSLLFFLSTITSSTTVADRDDVLRGLQRDRDQQLWWSSSTSPGEDGRLHIGRVTLGEHDAILEVSVRSVYNAGCKFEPNRLLPKVGRLRCCRVTTIYCNHHERRLRGTG